jgi:signal transduction histidine kinase
MRDEKNQPKSILSVSTEITQKKQLEAQRLESIGTLAGAYIAISVSDTVTGIPTEIQERIQTIARIKVLSCE